MNLNKEKIYTLVGVYNNRNIFTTLDGEDIHCLTYREYNRYIVGKLSCVNMRYSFQLNCWIIFQAVLL
jgi:hypothetical protein